MNLFGNDDGPAGLAVIPYVKLPSSVPVISNGAVEGGLILPLALRLPQDYLVTLMTEVDALQDSVGRRYPNFVNLVGVSHPLPGFEGANAMVELYSSVGTSRVTPPIYTFDLGMNFPLDNIRSLMSVSTLASTRPRRKCRSIPEYPPVFDCCVANPHCAGMNTNSALATKFVFSAARRRSAEGRRLKRKQNALALSAWVFAAPVIGWIGPGCKID
jgi:hypothetical protein